MLPVDGSGRSLEQLAAAMTAHVPKAETSPTLRKTVLITVDLQVCCFECAHRPMDFQALGRAHSQGLGQLDRCSRRRRRRSSFAFLSLIHGVWDCHDRALNGPHSDYRIPAYDFWSGPTGERVTRARRFRDGARKRALRPRPGLRRPRSPSVPRLTDAQPIRRRRRLASASAATHSIDTPSAFASNERPASAQPVIGVGNSRAPSAPRFGSVP